MNNDRSAAPAGRVATLIALPVALVAGFVAFQLLKPSPAPPAPAASPRVIPSGPVTVAAAQLPADHAAACRGLLAKLPDKVRDLPRRPIVGATDQAAAYGEVLLQCAGPQPSFAPTDLVYPISGVCWVPNEQGTRWSTVDRSIPIVIELGAGEAGEGSGQWAAAFSPAVATSIPAASAKPSGCG